MIQNYQADPLAGSLATRCADNDVAAGVPLASDVCRCRAGRVPLASEVCQCRAGRVPLASEVTGYGPSPDLRVMAGLPTVP